MAGRSLINSELLSRLLISPSSAGLLKQIADTAASSLGRSGTQEVLPGPFSPVTATQLGAREAPFPTSRFPGKAPLLVEGPRVPEA